MDNKLIKSNSKALGKMSIPEWEKFLQEYAEYIDTQRAKKTPKAAIEEREGAGNKKFQYVKEAYVLEELDKRLPGWSSEFVGNGIIQVYDAMICVGHIIYTEVVGGIAIQRKKMVIGAEQIKKLVNTDQPLKVDDMAKAALTDWYKQAGLKAAYIAADVYKRDSVLPTRKQILKYELAIKNSQDLIKKMPENADMKTSDKWLNATMKSWEAQKSSTADDFIDTIKKFNEQLEIYIEKANTTT